jgi:hypothetical protein
MTLLPATCNCVVRKGSRRAGSRYTYPTHTHIAGSKPNAACNYGLLGVIRPTQYERSGIAALRVLPMRALRSFWPASSWQYSTAAREHAGARFRPVCATTR